MKTALFAASLLAVPAFAGIYGEDTRYESQQEGPSKMIELARSVPALMHPSSLSLLPTGDYRLVDARTMTGFCPDVKFHGQPTFAGCSASLIAEDVVMTAGHCVDPVSADGCGGAKIVFDFALGKDTRTIRAENVFECEKLLYHAFDTRAPGEDLALIKLKRPVEGRDLVKVAPREPRLGDKLTMIGYPLGLPQKTVSDGELLRHDFSLYSFRHNLDTFSNNSGGPIFNQDLEQVGVLVRATSPNFSPSIGRSCHEWGVARREDYAEGNTLVHLQSELREFLRR